MPENQSLVEIVRGIYEQDGSDAIWKWAMDRPGPHGKAKRFNALTRFARIKRDSAKDKADRDKWAERRRVYAHERDKWEAEYEEQQTAADWPDSLVITECLYHDPPHFHLASPERKKLIVIGGIIHERFKCRIGEFPPFDPVENVHTGVSWHHRDPARPYVGLTYAQAAAHLGMGGDWGCALDVNDLDGGGDQEYAAFIEVKRRYQ